MLEAAQAKDFEPHLNTLFAVYFEEEPQQLELIGIDHVKGDTPENVERSPFSLVFRSSEPEAYIQQVYRITHESLGELSFFLVPIGPDDKGMRYEAVFS